MQTLDTLLLESGIETYGFCDTQQSPQSTALVILFPYNPVPPELSECSRELGVNWGSPLRIGAFAARNHYAAMVRILKILARALSSEHALPKNQFRVCVNSDQPEKQFALAAGLGFIGRSSLFISHAYGPACLIGALFMPAVCSGDRAWKVPVDSTESCGSCAACADACPTGAISPTGFQRERCLQHWMSRDDFPDHLLKVRGNRLYGCDECVRACPRSKGTGAEIPDMLLPAERRPGAFVDARDLAGKDAAAVREFFRGTALGMGWMPHAAWSRFAERCLIKY